MTNSPERSGLGSSGLSYVFCTVPELYRYCSEATDLRRGRPREKERIEIISGEVVMMAPLSSVRLFEKDGEAPEDVDTMVEPDISVVCDMRKIDKHGCKCVSEKGLNYGAS